MSLESKVSGLVIDENMTCAWWDEHVAYILSKIGSDEAAV